MPSFLYYKGVIYFMKIKVIIQKKSKLEEKFSFVVNQYNISQFFDYFFDYFENFEDVLVNFEEIKDTEKE